MDEHLWPSRLVKIMHEYSIALWKVRNSFIHEINKKQIQQQQIIRCQSQIEYLYRLDRTMMRQETLEIFKVPKHIRQRKSLESMGIWISMAELRIIIDIQRYGKTLDNCMFKHTAASIGKTSLVQTTLNLGANNINKKAADHTYQRHQPNNIQNQGEET